MYDYEPWGKESPDVPRKSVPRRMTVDELADVIDSALEGIAVIIFLNHESLNNKIIIIINNIILRSFCNM